jgi:hypothetical protein
MRESNKTDTQTDAQCATIPQGHLQHFMFERVVLTALSPSQRYCMSRQRRCRSLAQMGRLPVRGPMPQQQMAVRARRCLQPHNVSHQAVR